MGIFSRNKKKEEGDAFQPTIDSVTAAKPVVSADEKSSDKADKEEKKGKKGSKKEVKPAARGALAKEGAGNAYRVLATPVFTEKAANMQAQGKYVFLVAKSATKIDVASAIRDLYGVKPTSVRMIVQLGKQVRFGRFKGKEKDVKKAIVTLKKGDAIAVME